ncbi:hypothetical protein ACHAPW_002839 [Verticillium nonalfalfae]
MTNRSNAKRKRKQPARYTPEEAGPVQDGDFYPLFQYQLPVPLHYPRRQHAGDASETPALDPVALPFSPSSATTPVSSVATPSVASEVGVAPDAFATPSTASKYEDDSLTTSVAGVARPVIVSSSMHLDPPCLVPGLGRDKARSPRLHGVGVSDGASDEHLRPRSTAAAPTPSLRRCSSTVCTVENCASLHRSEQLASRNPSAKGRTASADSDDKDKTQEENPPPRRLYSGAHAEERTGGPLQECDLTCVRRCEDSLGHIDTDEKPEEAGDAKERREILVAPFRRRGSSVSSSSKPVTQEGRYSTVRDVEDPFIDTFDAAAGPGTSLC